MLVPKVANEGKVIDCIEAPYERACLGDWVRSNLSALEMRLCEQGALLLRGFHVDSPEAFQQAVDAWNPRQLDYIYRSTPRKKLTAGVFTATEYPARMAIPLHNENSYQRIWPLHLAFCCLQPATSGGRTPLASMRKVTASIPAAVLDKFDRLGVTYVRHYHQDVDLSWQEVFQVCTAAELEKCCNELDIHHSWQEDLLRTWQTCQGLAHHPVTGERVFFNQAHLFHVSALGDELAGAMLDSYGLEFLPRHARFGDGSELTNTELWAVREAFMTNAIEFEWQRGDVLLVDNMLMAHGRTPFTGTRSVLAALMRPSSDERYRSHPTPFPEHDP